MYRRSLTILLAWVLCVMAGAAEIPALVKALASEKDAERNDAIAELRKLAPAHEAELRKIEANETLEPRPMLILRKIIGERLIQQTPLKPLDPSLVTPFGEEKGKNVAGDKSILVNMDKKIIVLTGEFILEQGPLEYLVCTKGQNARLHETVAAVYGQPRDICYALLACNFSYAGDISEDGKINLPKDAGIMISVEFDWETPHANMGPVAQGAAAPAAPEKKTVRIPVEYFAWNSQTEKTMKRCPFAFTGSKIEKDPDTKKQVFMADIEKSIVALKLDSYAIINTPLDMNQVDPQHNAGYGINRFIIPPRHTPCRVIFEGWEGGELTRDALTDKGVDKGPAPAPTQTAP